MYALAKANSDGAGHYGNCPPVQKGSGVDLGYVGVVDGLLGDHRGKMEVQA